MPGVMNGYYDFDPQRNGNYNGRIDRDDSDSYDRRDDYRKELYLRQNDPYAAREDLYSRRIDDPHRRYNRDEPHYGTSIPRDGYRNGPQDGFGVRDNYRDGRFGAGPYPGPGDRDFARDGGRPYDLDHLATFTVGPQQGLIHPKDGLERLKNMEMTTGIWTMRCQMFVENGVIVIIDNNGEEMERFDLQQTINPAAVINRGRHNLYNNILMFTVQEDVSRGTQSEMHMFQVIGQEAQDIVDDIISAQAGRGDFPSRRNVPPPQDRPPRGMQNRARDHELAAERAARATAAYQPGIMPSQAFKQSMNRDDTESVLSEKAERDVQLLNCCFDDIEKFVGRLQEAATAYKELEKRRGRDKRKHRPGDGMLSMRARPPPAKDFIDVFQKFKLAFNLLAKLKPHIHDPNAPELVHFLFTPLSLVVEASKDPRHGTSDLAAKVVSPLLTRDAKDLLLNCLTSKESELWMSLGEAWTLSRDQWKGMIVPYCPRFTNGWQPAPALLEAEHLNAGPWDDRYRNGMDRQGSDYPTHHDRHSNRDPYRSDDDDPYRAYSHSGGPPRDAGSDRYDRYREMPRGRPLSPPPALQQAPARARSPRPTSPGPVSPRSFDGEQRAYMRELQSTDRKLCEAVADRTGANDKELTLKKGEILEVLDDSRNWWKLRNSRGVEGHAPFTILQNVSGVRR